MGGWVPVIGAVGCLVGDHEFSSLTVVDESAKEEEEAEEEEGEEPESGPGGLLYEEVGGWVGGE